MGDWSGEATRSFNVRGPVSFGMAAGRGLAFFLVLYGYLVPYDWEKLLKLLWLWVLFGVASSL